MQGLGTPSISKQAYLALIDLLTLNIPHNKGPHSVQDVVDPYE